MSLNFIKCCLLPNKTTIFPTTPSNKYILANIDMYRILIYPVYKNHFLNNFLCFSDQIYVGLDKDKKFNVSRLAEAIDIKFSDSHVEFIFNNRRKLLATYEAYAYYNIVLKYDFIKLCDLSNYEIVGIANAAARIGIISSSININIDNSEYIFKYSTINFVTLSESMQIKFFDIWLKRKDCIITGGTGIGKTTQIPKLLYWFNFLFDGFKQFKSVCDTNFKEYVFSKKLEKRSTVLSLPRKELIRRTAANIYKSLGFETINGSPLILKFKNKGKEFENQNSNVFFNNLILSVHKITVDLISICNSIILDEVHEHDISCDICISIFFKKKEQYAIRNLILMSATIESDMLYIKKFFKNTISIIYLPSAKLFPIKEISALNKDIVDIIFNNLPPLGSVSLIFLSTVSEIDNLYEKILNDNRYKLSTDIILYKIHSKSINYNADISYMIQDTKHRSLAICTNLLESSITISNAKVVIDTGKFYMQVFLYGKINYISKSMAEQRKGRVGRTSEGTYIKLYNDDKLPSTINNTDNRYLFDYIIVFKYHNLDLKDSFFVPPSDITRVDKVINYLKYNNIDIDRDIRNIYNVYRTNNCSMVEYISLYLTLNTNIRYELSALDSSDYYVNNISDELKLILIRMNILCKVVNVQKNENGNVTYTLSIVNPYDGLGLFKYSGKIMSNKKIYLCGVSPIYLLFSE